MATNSELIWFPAYNYTILNPKGEAAVDAIGTVVGALSFPSSPPWIG